MRLLSFILLILYLLAYTLAKDCTTDNDCQDRFQHCNSDLKCQHKSLLPLQVQQIISPFVLMITISLSNAAGIGGGGTTLPVLLLILRFRQSEAVALANFIIFIGAVARYITGYKAKDLARPHHTVIQYDFVIILIPMALFGTLIGVYVNQTFPQVVLLILLLMLFVYVLYSTFQKGCKIWKKEIQKAKERKVQMENNQSKSKGDKSSQGLQAKQQQQLQQQSRRDVEDKAQGNIEGAYQQIDQKQKALNKFRQNSNIPINTNLDPQLKAKLQKILKNQSSHWQWKKLFIIWGNFLALVIVSLLRGSKGTSIIGLQSCSALDWILQLILLLVCLSCVLLASKLLSYQNSIKVAANYPVDTNWTKRTIFRFSMFSMLVGIISGSLGLGGGVIITPMLLSTNKTPSVASATSLYIILYISTSTWFQLLLSDTLNIQYGLYEGGFVFIGALLGLWVIRRIVEKTGKESFLVFLLFGLTLLAMMLMPVFNGLRLARESDQGQNIWAFNSPC